MVNNQDDLCPHIAAMWMFLCGCKCGWSLLVKRMVGKYLP